MGEELGEAVLGLYSRSLHCMLIDLWVREVVTDVIVLLTFGAEFAGC
jgi:hypothetical protein